MGGQERKKGVIFLFIFSLFLNPLSDYLSLKRLIRSNNQTVLLSRICIFVLFIFSGGYFTLSFFRLVFIFFIFFSFFYLFYLFFSFSFFFSSFFLCLLPFFHPFLVFLFVVSDMVNLEIIRLKTCRRPSVSRVIAITFF